MMRNKRVLMGLAVVGSLILMACGGQAAEPSSGGGDSAGEPVAGGTGRILLVNEPRSLDPAAIGNSASAAAAVGNALYGTLMTNDVETGEIEYKMAESFTTEDGGKTFVLKLRDGLTFSDGTPLDAEAVKFNWDRHMDPATASYSIREAVQIESSEVVDARTLKITLVTPIPRFGHAVLAGSMNWIASPDALRPGPAAFDENPVGAGPFMLESWRRQDKMELVRNPNYWDAPKPYLDALTLRPVVDTAQRLNTLISGAGDLAVLTNWRGIADARDQGLQAEVVPMSGGQALYMNTLRAPFDDVRAREAIAAAIDLEAIDLAVFEGAGEVPTTLFKESSPFYSDIPLVQADKEKAQALFDELAADGKEVSFTFTAYSTAESKDVAEAVQAQLSGFDNVDVEIRFVDSSEIPSIYAAKDFEMLISSSQLVDPEPELWADFHGDSSANLSGIDDPQLNEALDKGRRGETTEQRKAAYDQVQELLAELVPAVFYTRSSSAAVARENVHGIDQYGLGSLLSEELWIAP